uniref:Undecaprenyl-diphosphatase n=1 Tax=Bosea sp. NBC_00436 TaxID=2969620 RepID=A0A9E7ZTE3_9HYPH
MTEFPTMLALDTALFLAINAGPNPIPYVALFAIAVTRFAILLVPFYIVALWIRGSRRRRLLAFALILALAIAMTLSFIAGIAVFRPRPFMVDLGHTLVDHRSNASFPSNHALVFAVCVIVLALVRRYGMACLGAVLGALVGWSRIYVGVHYPSDLLGALILAIPAALLSLAVTARYGVPIVAAVEHLQHRLQIRLIPFRRS